MINHNLVISVVGDYSTHKEWIRGNPEFDLALIYYGNDKEKFSNYTRDAFLCIKQKGEKYPLVKSFINHHYELVSKYEYIWLPDDDISISTDKLNHIFKIAKDYDLHICQPSVVSSNGKVSHEITRSRKGLKLRFTNFVEVMMPLFHVKSLLFLYDDFDLSVSGWGLDASWSHRLNDPKDKIAVIDEISAVHTKPVGSDYSRFKISPEDELKTILKKYDLRFTRKNYASIVLNDRFLHKFLHAGNVCKVKWRKKFSNHSQIKEL